VGALLLDVRLGHDLSREVEPLAEVVETLGGEGVVVPLPGELGLEVAARGEGLASLDDLGRMLGLISCGGLSGDRIRKGSWCQCRRALAG
jgi:hypothetical protein